MIEPIDEKLVKYLEQQAKEVRGMILDQVYNYRNGHIGSAFSLVEILLILYNCFLRIDPKNVYEDGRDILILSKGHGCSALYAVLIDLDIIPKECLYVYQNGSILGGHPDSFKVPGVEFSTGSLGHGLSVAAGMALAAKIDEKQNKIFCIIGDGEMQEGSIWEAAMFAAYHNLRNLIVIVDRNYSQSCGLTIDVLNPDPVIDKWRAFGWGVWHTNGHILNDLYASLTEMVIQPNGSMHIPKVLIARTVRGKGVSFMEEDNKWHVGVPSYDEIMAAKEELRLI